MNEHELAILRQFCLDAEPASCTPYGCGHINRTYLVATAGGRCYILQKINHHTFRDVAGLMENIELVTEHLRRKSPDPRSVLTLIRTKDGKSYLEADDGYWRVFRFVEDSICLQQPESDADFYESAVGFGTFQQLLSDFPAEKLHETIPNFHNTPDRYRAFHETLTRDPMHRAAQVQPEIEFALARQAEMAALQNALDAGELPLRVGELGLVHRHELKGALHGLFRVRCFTQDDAHIFMTWDQMKDEIKNVVRLFDEVYSTFGLTYQIELSTMPEDHMGDIKDWQFAEKTLAEAITEIGKDYVVNEGDGAFYGPKLDFHLADSIGRTWQCGTIQLDMQLPERFELEYTGADGEKHRPVMIHRVVLGSIERFIGVITEHFAGAFPTWLAPEQVRVMPMTDRNIPCAQEVMKQLTDKGFRATMDDRNEKIGYKIREAQSQKIPYMLVLGDKEAENDTISVRTLSGEQSVEALPDFIARLQADVKSRKS